MGLLKDNKVVADSESIDLSFSPSGFDLIDSLLGDNGNPYKTGIPTGKLYMLAGDSQTGKTTLALQLGYNLVKKTGGDVVLFDFERSSTDMDVRIHQITGCPKDKVGDIFTIIKDNSLCIEELKKQIHKICEMKEKLGNAAKYDTVDINGQPVKAYIPTVIIIDSLPALRTKEVIDNADLDGNMMYAATAKHNNSFFTSVSDKWEQYNVTCIIVAHISKKISINPYEEKVKQLPTLGADDYIAGGQKVVYLCSYILRLKAGKEFKADDGLGIIGRNVTCNLIKSRTSFNVKGLNLAFSETSGFNNVLTNFQIIKDAGKIKGSGHGYWLDSLPEVKFKQKEFLSTYRNNPEFRLAFNTLAKQTLNQINKIVDLDVDFLPDELSGLDDL
jgi:RecA/RadA recombinase